MFSGWFKWVIYSFYDSIRSRINLVSLKTFFHCFNLSLSIPPHFHFPFFYFFKNFNPPASKRRKQTCLFASITITQRYLFQFKSSRFCILLRQNQNSQFLIAMHVVLYSNSLVSWRCLAFVGGSQYQDIKGYDMLEVIRGHRKSSME